MVNVVTMGEGKKGKKKMQEEVWLMKKNRQMLLLWKLYIISVICYKLRVFYKSIISFINRNVCRINFQRSTYTHKS